MSTALIITSISNDINPVLQQYAVESAINNVRFIVIGDTKSPKDFSIENCDFYSIERQEELAFEMVKYLPKKNYARKNIGYLVAIMQGMKIIIETDDDNIPYPNFWDERKLNISAHVLTGKDWVNVYKYFTDVNIWPRGFALEKLQNLVPLLPNISTVYSPIQQGLANDNPDVDAIYRLTLPLPISFKDRNPVALGEGTICPFNSQNTTWFNDAFPLLYLPSYCSFRMTDIWRSFIAQRIGWTCGWHVSFGNKTVRQVRNEHDLMLDFRDEIPGYIHNLDIMKALMDLNLDNGARNIPENMKRCYAKLIAMGLIESAEMMILESWLVDIANIKGLNLFNGNPPAG